MIDRRSFVRLGAATGVSVGASLLVLAQQSDPDNSVVRCRISRPTNRLQEVVAFYRDCLGFDVTTHFENRGGYSGAVLRKSGLPLELEFTQTTVAGSLPIPSRDDLLVIYIPDAASYQAAVTRLEAKGNAPVEPFNPYWTSHGMTFQDPDAWHIVLSHES